MSEMSVKARAGPRKKAEPTPASADEGNARPNGWSDDASFADAFSDADDVQDVHIDLGIRATIKHVLKVDMVAETFSAEVGLACRWRCPKEDIEEALEKGKDRLDYDWEPSWIPQVYFWGMVEMSNPYRTFWSELDKVDGQRVVWLQARMRFLVCISERFYLHNFPYDVQDFNIILRVHNARSVFPLRDADAAARVGRLMELPGLVPVASMPAMYRIVTGVLYETTAAARPHDHISNREPDRLHNQIQGEAHGFATYPAVHVILFYRREWRGYYRWNVIRLLFLIKACSVGAWAIHWRDVSDRLGLDVTLLLVAVAFKQVLATLVPPISYLTLLDVYAFSCIFQLTLAMSMHAAMGFTFEDCDTITGNCLFHFDRESGYDGTWMPNAYNLDYAMCFVYGLVFIGFDVAYSFHVRKLQRRILKMSDKRSPPPPLEGYLPCDLVEFVPTGRPRIDVQAMLADWYDD